MATRESVKLPCKIGVQHSLEGSITSKTEVTEDVGVEVLEKEADKISQGETNNSKNWRSSCK